MITCLKSAKVASLSLMLIQIEDVDDPRLDEFRDMPRSRVSRHRENFIVESRLVVDRLLKSEFETRAIVCHHDSLTHLTETIRAKPTIPVYVLHRPALRELIGYKLHRGVLAAARRPTNPSLADFVQHTEQLPLHRRNRIFLVCSHVVDPVNLAGIIRNASAFGVDGLIVGENTTDVFSRRVVRVSMGSIFRLAIRTSEDHLEDLRQLGQIHGFHRVATVLDDDADRLSAQSSPTKLALVFGSEGPGLSSQVVDVCDQRVTLPMQPGTDSLNVATATGVFLYHYTSTGRTSG